MDQPQYLFNRRNFLKTTVGGMAAATFLPLSILSAQPEKRIKAIAFDAFPIFDPRPIFNKLDELFPEKGAAISNSWRTAQFEYTWLRNSGNQYADFWKVTDDALKFAAIKNGVVMTDTTRNQILDQYLYLKAWPDVEPSLKTLKQQGFKIAFLSNFTEQMLRANIKSAGLDGYFDEVLSTDRVKAFKPSPRAYQMAMDIFKFRKEEIAFAAFAGWDAVGAKWFGYPTYWVNRQNAPLDELSARPDGEGNNLKGLLDFVRA